MGKRILVLLALLAVIVTTAYIVPPVGYVFLSLGTEPLRTAVILVASVIVAFTVYRLVANVIRTAIFRSKGTEGDVKMITGLWRIIVIFLTLLVFFSFYFELGVIGAIISAFGGMFLGWSLQQPVSGFAAWLIVTVKRPFRIGDRIQRPSQALVGDVVDVDPMYTVLNQVGGAVGSEEPVGRHILIPNAMLFGNLIINYTPKAIEEKRVLRLDKKLAVAYILDEVVIRLTYDSDWNEAERILINAARHVTSNIVKEMGEEPYIRSDMYDMVFGYGSDIRQWQWIDHESSTKLRRGSLKRFNRTIKLTLPFPTSIPRNGVWDKLSPRTNRSTCRLRTRAS
jgi:small-conductance mechanosensitive channel